MASFRAFVAARREGTDPTFAGMRTTNLPPPTQCDALPPTPLLESTSPELAAALRRAGGADKLRAVEAYLETQTAPPPPPLPPPPPPGPATRVLLLAYANNWMSDGDRKKVWNWSSRATGAVVATNALARSLRSWARLDIVCIDGELDAHAERYPDGACTIVAWERFGITKGPRDAVDTLVARRTGEWDVVLCASTDESLFAVAKTSDARRTCAFVHELIELPCGPWSRRPSQSDRALEGIKLLCTSSYVRDYIELWAPRLHAVTCYAADYACFGGDVPRYAP